MQTIIVNVLYLIGPELRKSRKIFPKGYTLLLWQLMAKLFLNFSVVRLLYQGELE